MTQFSIYILIKPDVILFISQFERLPISSRAFDINRSHSKCCTHNENVCTDRFCTMRPGYLKLWMPDKRVLYVGLFSLCAYIPCYFLPSTKKVNKSCLHFFERTLRAIFIKLSFKMQSEVVGQCGIKQLLSVCVLYALEQSSVILQCIRKLSTAWMYT